MNNNYNDYNDYKPFASDCLWKIKDVIKVLFFYFFMAYAGAPALFQSVNYIIGQDLADNFGENITIIIFSIFVSAISCLYIIYIVRIEYKLPLTSLGLTFVNLKQNILEGLKKYLIAIPIFALAGLFMDFICKLTGLSPEQQEIAKRVLEEDSAGVLIPMIIFGVFAAPIVEEIVFRGFLQTALNKRFGRWGAILFSSFFFRLCT